MLWRVKPGRKHSSLKNGKLERHKEGDIVELAPHQAAPFADALEPADEEALQARLGVTSEE